MIPSNDTLFAALFWIGVLVVVARIAQRARAHQQRPGARELIALERVRLEAENAALRAREKELIGQVDYWRARLERYVDIRLAKADGVHEPVMSATDALDKIAQFPGMGGAAIMEIDSTKGL